MLDGVNADAIAGPDVLEAEPCCQQGVLCFGSTYPIIRVYVSMRPIRIVIQTTFIGSAALKRITRGYKGHSTSASRSCTNRESRRGSLRNAVVPAFSVWR